MRVLLVTLTDLLPFTLSKVLNPALEYCAIVVDDAEVANKIFKNYPQIINLIRPFYDLQECIDNLYYDFVLCISDSRILWTIYKKFVECELPREKFFQICIYPDAPNDSRVEKTLRFYKEHATEFEMFATGISYSAVALENKYFKYRLFNFARSSQDLYYDYQTAKFVFNQNESGGGSSSIA